MGRPPLKMSLVHVRMPPELATRIDALVGNYGRAQFIREAVEKEVERREQSKAP